MKQVVCSCRVYCNYLGSWESLLINLALNEQLIYVLTRMNAICMYLPPVYHEYLDFECLVYW